MFLISTLLYPGDGNTSSHTIKIIVPEVALLDIESESSKNIFLEMTAPTEAGDRLISNIDDSIWLNVTSIVSIGKSRDISVKIDETISGIDLKVSSTQYSGSGYGYWGTPSTELSLNTNEQILVSGITNGKTGNGYNNGFNLKYSAKIDNTNIENLVSSDGKNITVTYTLAN